MTILVKAIAIVLMSFVSLGGGFVLGYRCGYVDGGEEILLSAEAGQSGTEMSSTSASAGVN